MPACFGYSQYKVKGFTLIELLVAISIIAILSAVGLVSYNGIRGKAQEARIKSDINAIKKAYESNYDPTANGGQGGYKVLTGANFSSGSIPTPNGAGTSYIIPVSSPNPVDGTLPNFAVGYNTQTNSSCNSLSEAGCYSQLSNQGTPVDTGMIGTPAIISGCVLWLKSNAGITKDGSNRVSNWSNSCGSSNATQAGSTRQPLFVDNALNSTPILRFDGVDDYMSTSVVPATGANPRTLVAVVTNTQNTAVNYLHILHYGTASVSDATYGITSRTANTNSIGNHYWGSGFLSSQIATSNPLILIMGYGSNRDELWVNGTAKGSLTKTLATGSNSGILIGTRVNPAEYGKFDIAEIIAYNKLLSSTERKNIEQYLSQKYNITVNP